MEVRHLQILGAFLLAHFVMGSAQFYGSYGQNSYFAPITFPEPQSQRVPTTLPLLSRVGIENVPDIQKTSNQISRGSELFSFEMYYVS